MEKLDCEKVLLYSTDERLIKIYLYLICVNIRDLRSIIDSFNSIKLSDLLGIVIRIFNNENNDKLFFLIVNLCLDYPISYEFIQNQIDFNENEIQQKIFFSIRTEFTIDLSGVCIGKNGVKYICNNIDLLPNLQNLFFCYDDVYPEGMKYLKKQINKIPNLYTLFNLCSNLNSNIYFILLKYYISNHYYLFDCIFIYFYYIILVNEIKKLEIKDVENILLNSSDAKFTRIFLYLICINVNYIKSIVSSFREMDIDCIFYNIYLFIFSVYNEKQFSI